MARYTPRNECSTAFASATLAVAHNSGASARGVGTAQAEEWVSVTKAIEEERQTDVLVETPMIRINGDIRDAANKREYTLQKLSDGQSKRLVIDLAFRLLQVNVAVDGNRRSAARWTSISMTFLTSG